MHDEFRKLYESDLCRYTESEANHYIRWFHYYFRKASLEHNKVKQLYYRFRLKRIREKHGLEIGYTCKIGKGLYIGHPYNITINDDVVLGENINIHKGVTIGQENRGARKGTPTIGNMVWIGVNATIVGNIKIGDDVLISPNSFVNRDIPAHSVVFGNPCVIKHRDNATEGYINRVFQN